MPSLGGLAVTVLPEMKKTLDRARRRDPTFDAFVRALGNASPQLRDLARQLTEDPSRRTR